MCIFAHGKRGFKKFHVHICMFAELSWSMICMKKEYNFGRFVRCQKIKVACEMNRYPLSQTKVSEILCKPTRIPFPAASTAIVTSPPASPISYAIQRNIQPKYPFPARTLTRLHPHH